MYTLTQGKKFIRTFLHENANNWLKETHISAAQIKRAVDYLHHYGYLPHRLIQKPSFKNIRSAVKKFQQAYGLKTDGKAGPLTLRAMSLPRCGCFDIFDPDNSRHKEQQQVKQFAKEKLTKWRKSGLTYSVQGYVRGPISKTSQLRIFQQAFDSWSEVANIKIKAIRSPKTADLIINVGSGSSQNFDGAGGTLAWAYLPNNRNTQLLMRFDLAENWIKDPQAAGILLLNVAAHEFGHMLGLTHSKKKSALMAPYYKASIASPQPVDDIPRIQELYGVIPKSPVSPPMPKAPKPKPTKFKLVCSDLQIEGYSLVKNTK